MMCVQPQQARTHIRRQLFEHGFVTKKDTWQRADGREHEQVNEKFN